MSYPEIQTDSVRSCMEWHTCAVSLPSACVRGEAAVPRLLSLQMEVPGAGRAHIRAHIRAHRQLGRRAGRDGRCRLVLQRALWRQPSSRAPVPCGARRRGPKATAIAPRTTSNSTACRRVSDLVRRGVRIDNRMQVDAMTRFLILGSRSPKEFSIQRIYVFICV